MGPREDGSLREKTNTTRTPGGIAARRRRRTQATSSPQLTSNDLLRPAEVELLRSLWETGLWSYEALAEKFDVTPAVAKGIAHFKIHS